MGVLDQKISSRGVLDFYVLSYFLRALCIYRAQKLTFTYATWESILVMP